MANSISSIGSQTSKVYSTNPIKKSSSYKNTSKPKTDFLELSASYKRYSEQNKNLASVIFEPFDKSINNLNLSENSNISIYQKKSIGIYLQNIIAYMAYNLSLSK